jgi:hypothetical protein
MHAAGLISTNRIQALDLAALGRIRIIKSFIAIKFEHVRQQFIAFWSSTDTNQRL